MTNQDPSNRATESRNEIRSSVQVQSIEAAVREKLRLKGTFSVFSYYLPGIDAYTAPSKCMLKSDQSQKTVASHSLPTMFYQDVKSHRKVLLGAGA